MRPLIIDSFAGGGASEGIRAAIGRQTYGMNSRPWTSPTDHTVRHALAKPRLGMLRIRFNGRRDDAGNSITAQSSFCAHTKHLFQFDEPRRIKFPFLHSASRAVLSRSPGIARFLSKLNLKVSAILQAGGRSCGFTTRTATLDKVNGGVA